MYHVCGPVITDSVQFIIRPSTRNLRMKFWVGPIYTLKVLDIVEVKPD